MFWLIYMQIAQQMHSARIHFIVAGWVWLFLPF